MLDSQRRIRHAPPPAGWYLPAVAARTAELDSFDGVEGLVIQGGVNVEVLTGVSLHGGLVAAWPEPGLTAKLVVERLIGHWQAWGLPSYAQFDNGTIFQGAHQWRDNVGRVMRLCLSLGVTPVFAPVAEYGFQAAIESWNGRWQAKVWRRFHHDSLAALAARSAAHLAAVRQRGAVRIERAPARRAFPEGWELDLQTPPAGILIFLRRTSDRGDASLLGRTFPVDPLWTHRLVRAEVLLDEGVIHFYALRRREPTQQPRLATLAYELPRRPFRG